MKGTDVGEVVVVLGAGSIGQAITRRVSAGKHVLLADLRLENADAAAVVLADAGFDTSTTIVDVSNRESVLGLVEKATSLGDVTGLIHAAGVSPSQASPESILHVDLYGTALVLEEFGRIIAPRGVRGRDRLAVRAPIARSVRRTGPGSGDHPGGEVAVLADAAARSGD
jgi:NAD(P)-dependent dehydrogenase (short-subunit alcohol dehydrogenase family)